MITDIKSKPVFGIAATEHLIDVFKNGVTNSDAGKSHKESQRIKMISKDMLKNVHKIIIS